jgi:hypothetical protein
MKITNYLLLSLTFLLLNCSASNDEKTLNNGQTTEKNLIKVTGENEHLLNYENGKITKAWDNSHTFRSQMVYNSNGTMSKEYRGSASTSWQDYDNENFEWEISVSDRFIENVYENGKLKYIMQNDGGVAEKLVEYTYQGDLVVEKRRYYSAGILGRYFRYEYNDQNELVTIIWDESPSGGSSYTLQVTFDDKINPYYKIWKETKLTFWYAQAGLARHNLEFYPHNLLSLKEGVNDVWYNAFYTYNEDNLPITLRITEARGGAGDYYFEYQ